MGSELFPLRMVQRWLLTAGRGLLGAVLIAVVAEILVFFTNRALARALVPVLSRDHQREGHLRVRRREVLLRMPRRAVRLVLYGLAVVAILELWRVNTLPLVLGLSCAVGLAGGLGLQSLVRDVVAGYCLLAEDQLAPGDEVTIGSVRGRVVEMGLRATCLVDENQQVHIIANGDIRHLCNHSKAVEHPTGGNQ